MNPLNWTLLASISIERSNLLLEYQEIGHDVVVRLGGMGGMVLQQSDFKTLVQRLSAGQGWSHGQLVWAPPELKIGPRTYCLSDGSKHALVEILRGLINPTVTVAASPPPTAEPWQQSLVRFGQTSFGSHQEALLEQAQIQGLALAEAFRPHLTLGAAIDRPAIGPDSYSAFAAYLDQAIAQAKRKRHFVGLLRLKCPGLPPEGQAKALDILNRSLRLNDSAVSLGGGGFALLFFVMRSPAGRFPPPSGCWGGSSWCWGSPGRWLLGPRCSSNTPRRWKNSGEKPTRPRLEAGGGIWLA